MSKYVTEFIGTFFLVLVIGLSVLSQSSIAPLAIGSALMVMVYMGGHISGAHYNPAVTIAVALRGKCRWLDVVPYWIAQLAGACAAAYVVYWVFGQTLEVKPGPNYLVGQGLLTALLVEGLFAFALALVVLNVATSKKTADNSYYGLAIGFTVLAAAAAGGGVSGGAFNPAVAFGPWVVHSIVHNVYELSYAWIYLIGPCAGAVAAAAVFRMQNPEDFLD